MLNRFFARPLAIDFDGQRVSFNSLAEFEFSLAGRTDVPSRKFLELMLLSNDELRHEAQNLKHTEQRLVDTLSSALKTPGTIGQSLRDMDLAVFSPDHGWREIIAALRDRDEEFEELQQVAVAKYMQYLTARQEILKHIASIKHEGTRRGAQASRESGTDDLSRVIENAPADAAAREAVMLHSQGNHAPAPAKKSSYARLPKGEVVVIDVERGQTIELMLSRHGFKIVAGEDLTLIDETGVSHTLQNGRNIIGRDTICNIVVNSNLRDISRLHLIIERLTPDSLRLTDLSAHGTYLPAQFLNKPA